MEQVKIIRLKTGEDVISYIEDYEIGKSILRTPMAVLVKFDSRNNKQTVLMDHWLPINVIKENEAILDNTEILTMMDPTPEFSMYYEDSIEAIANAIKSSSDVKENNEGLSEEEISLMESLEPVGSKYIH